MVKAKYGSSDRQKQNLKIMGKELINALSEIAYEKRLRFMRTITDADPRPSMWMEYFTRNWDGIRPNWCSYLRCAVPHFRNNTNNRLESSWR